jgi:hypothetical protein
LQNDEKPLLPKWTTINYIVLYQSDEDILLGNEWLNDKHIHVAQTLIKEQFSNICGLHPTILQANSKCLPPGSLQIMHSDGNHWLTASTLNRGTEDIVVYNSMYASVTESTHSLLAKLVNTDKPSFSVQMANVMKQTGNLDCGLFAIAYMTHISYNLDPSLCVFEQTKMRSHLH